MSSTVRAEELRELSAQAQPFPPPRRLPLTFLTLAPRTSDSYPQKTTTQPLTAETLAQMPKKSDATDAMKRRTSSLSSDGSKSGFRFLKLGPVHFGEHQGEDKNDFFEVAVVE